MTFPKISIVTPSFNQAEFLERTIQSILNQNYPNLEYIIIDGGSTDGSVDIIKKYKKHLSYWESTKDNGQYYAIQKGFDKCTGDVMAWINSDDIYHTKSLFIVAEIFNSFPQIKWLTGNISFIDDQDKIICSRIAKSWSRFNLHKGDHIWIQQESTFWKKSLWESAGAQINLKLNYAADFDLWIRFLKIEKLYTTEALLGAFRLRKSNQKTLEGKSAYMDEYYSILEKEKISKEDKTKLRLISIFENFILKIPVIKRISILRNSYYKLYDYPPVITFDRISYTYKFKT